MDKISKIRKEISSILPLVFNERSYQKLLIQLHDEGRIGQSMKKKLLKDAKKLDLKWNTNPEYKLLSLDKDKVAILDILKAFQPAYFFSHHSALYFHQITNQRPEEYFLSKEIKGRIPQHTKDRAPARVRQAFLKAPRKTTKYLRYKKTKINLLEKQDLKRKGIIKIKLQYGGQDMDGYEIYLTSMERTLMDSIIKPHYSGGLKTLAMAFSVGKIKVDKLYDIYKTYDPFYPYWQSIGFMLQIYKGEGVARKWLKYFQEPKIDFYLDRGFRDDWLYNPEWKIYYPKGLNI